jgi:phosphosulfolactate phosphohydrolase-like enzyme
MHVHVAFTPQEHAQAPLGIVVDVLRGTSTIAQALASGYRRIRCCAEIEEARALRAELPGSLVGAVVRAARDDESDVA